MNLIKIFLVMAVFASITFADALAAISVNAVPEFDKSNNDVVSSAVEYDTLSGADTSVMFTDFTPIRGWEYVLVRDAITGTGSDSAYYYIRVDCKDAKRGNVLYSVNTDTINGSTGTANTIPFGNTLIGTAFDVYLVGVAGSTGGQVILNRAGFWRRRPRTVFKAWN